MTERVFFNKTISFNKNIIKVLLLISSILTIFALLSLESTLPVTNYEVSIYSAAPLFWFLIILSNLILISCMILQAQNENYKYFWLSFSLLLLNNFIILSQPLMRGYFAYGTGDPWNHYKSAMAITESGTIGNDYYPITHILLAELNQLTNLNMEIFTKFLPAYFSMIYMVFTYFLGKEVFKNKRYAVILAAVSSTFLLTYYQVVIYPQGLSILILPLFFYLFFKSDKSISYNILIVLLLFLMPFFHPFVEITLITCLIAAEIIKYILDRRSISLNKSIVSIVMFFAWWSSFTVFDNGVKKINSWLFREVSSVPRTNELAFTHSMSFLDTVLLFLKCYGSQLIYISIALIAIILILWKYKKGDKYLNRMIILSVLFITSLITYFMTFLTQGVTSIGRLLGSNMAVWAVPLLVSFPLFLILKNFNKKKLAFLLIFIVISSSFTVSVLGIYRSSWIDQPNWHFTYSDASAINWEKDFKSPKTKYIHIGMPINGIILNNLQDLNYNNITSLADLYPDPVLFVYGKTMQNIIMSDPDINQSSMIEPWAYPNFNNDTANKIQFDTKVGYVYSNGAIDIYYIKR